MTDRPEPATQAQDEIAALRDRLEAADKTGEDKHPIWRSVIMPRQILGARILMRLDEIEAVATRATPGTWTADGQSIHTGHELDAVVEYAREPADLTHIAAHAPKVVLRWAAGLRALAYQHIPDWTPGGGISPYCPAGCHEDGGWGMGCYNPCPTIRALGDALGIEDEPWETTPPGGIFTP